MGYKFDFEFFSLFEEGIRFEARSFDIVGFRLFRMNSVFLLSGVW